ncbi:MAG TPA: flagellar basal body-associated FliL family protein [Methylovirgula sp.]
MAATAEAKPLSLGKFIGLMVMMTIVAVGVGGGLGLMLVGRASTTLQALLQPKPVEPSAKYSANFSLLDLPPIITNLADPATAWIRLQAAIIYDNKAVSKPELLAAQIGEDLLAYMKTATLAQIGGASGLDHLREDLNERARIRSEGHVHEVVIQTVVVQ